MVIALTLAAVPVAIGQEVSTEVILSEDELLDALSNGEIDYDTYVLLLDLLLNGIDSSDMNILDLLPSSLASRAEQSRDFLTGAGGSVAGKSYLKYRFGGELKDSGRTRYRATGRYFFSQYWTVDLGLAGEYTGRERFLHRSIMYSTGAKAQRTKMTIGNFRTRLGLGTIVGYRGKLLDYSDKIDGESFLSPDFGGFNGLLAEKNWQAISAVVLGSMGRDSTHSIATAAGQIGLTKAAYLPGAAIALHSIQNRTTDEKVQLIQSGINATHKWKNGSIAGEAVMQAGDYNSGAAVITARNLWRTLNANLSGWTYGREYFGLTSGSSSASLSATCEIAEVDFSYSDRRSGQTGVRAQSELQVLRSSALTSDLVFAHRGKDTSTLQGLAGIDQKINAQNSVTADFQYKSTLKSSTPESIRRRGRIGWRYDDKAIRAQTTAGFTNESTHGEYWSLLVRLLAGKKDSEQWQVWSNWRRIARGTVESWYGFVSVSENLAKDVRGAIKFTDTYSRTTSPRHSPALNLELQVVL